MVEPAPRPMRMPPPIKVRRERSTAPRVVVTTEDAEAVEEFTAALAKVQERRSTVAPAAKRVDYARMAANLLARRPAPKPVKAAPTEPAPNRESCVWCGVPGWKGCDHWLPCDAAPVIPKTAVSKPIELTAHSGANAKRLTAEELDFVSARRAMPRKELHAEFVAAFPDRQITVTSINYILARAGRTG